MARLEGNLTMGIHGTGFYKPYYVWDGEEYREVNNIHVFTETGIMFSVGHGWLSEKGNQLVKSFTVECEYYITNKRKPKFDLKVPFLISIKSLKRYNYHNRKYCEVYIPYESIPLDYVEHVYRYDTPTAKVYHDYWVTGDVWIKIRSVLEPIIENTRFVQKVTPLTELLGIDYVNQNTLIENKDEILKLIKELSKTL